MEFFSGFSWPVPRAFGSAVAACRFEQGDVLFDDAVAYTADAASWGDVAGQLGFSIQVLDPPRSARNTPSDAGGRRFDANWESPVTFEVHDYRADRTRVAESTQARLFTCLWRGDPGLLEEEGGEIPARPASGRELHAALEEAVPVLRGRATGPADGLLFAFVVDEANEASLAKQRAVVAALEASLAVRVDVLAPQDALPARSDFHPALRICACAVATPDEDAVRSLLKAVLYAPTGGKEDCSGDEPAASDRFRLERHGALVAARG